MIKASICTIGDEILIGQIVDTNSSMISRKLGELGIEVSRMLSISDGHDDIVPCAVVFAPCASYIVPSDNDIAAKPQLRNIQISSSLTKLP